VANEPNGPEPSSTETIMRSATLHGHDLRKLGFTIEQVVYDYGDICQAVTELAMSEGAAVTTAGAVPPSRGGRLHSFLWRFNVAYAPSAAALRSLQP
jgi:hypothetical protein